MSAYDLDLTFERDIWRKKLKQQLTLWHLEDTACPSSVNPNTQRNELMSLRSCESQMVGNLQEIMRIYHMCPRSLRNDSFSMLSNGRWNNFKMQWHLFISGPSYLILLRLHNKIMLTEFWNTIYIFCQNYPLTNFVNFSYEFSIKI